MNPHNTTLTTLLWSLLLLPTGCGMAPKGPLHVPVVLAADLNNDRPLAVRIVVLPAAGTPSQLGPKALETWFEKRADLLRRRENVFVYEWEWVPGQVLPTGVALQPVKGGLFLISADYRDHGRQSLIQPGNRPFRLEFGPRRFRAVPLQTPEKPRRPALPNPQNRTFPRSTP